MITAWVKQAIQFCRRLFANNGQQSEDGVDEALSPMPSLPPINITQTIRKNSGKVIGAIVNLPDPNAKRLLAARNILMDRVKVHWIAVEDAARPQQAALQAIETHHNAFVQGAGLLHLNKRYMAHEVEASSQAADVVAHLDDNDGTTHDSIAPTEPLYHIFNASGQALLILGEPGVGKTVSLLQIARDALADAEADPEKPVPVILNLASWANEPVPIAEWLMAKLNHVQYGIPKDITRMWLKNNRILLLLDGLHELDDEQRNHCVKELNDFVETYSLSGVVVCCRTTAYESLATRLALQTAIVIEPLSTQQLDSYFESAGDNLAGLRTALARDEELKTLAKTPLMLRIMSQAYADMDSGEIMPSEELSRTMQRQQLFDAYIERMFRYGGDDDKPYSDRQTIAWLSQLALQISKSNRRIFLLEEMQAGWLTVIRRGWVYALGTRVAYGLLLGLLFAGILLFSNGLILGMNLVIVDAGTGADVNIIKALRREELINRIVALFLSWLVSGFALAGVEIVLWQAWLKIENLRVRTLLKTLAYVGTIGVVSGVTFALFDGGLWETGLFYGLLLGILGGLFLALSDRHGTIQTEIRRVEKVQISWMGSLQWMLGGFLIGGLLGYLLDNAAQCQLFFWYWPTLEPEWLRQMLAATTVVGPIIALFGIVFGGFKGVLLKSRVRPNQGMWLSAWNMLYAGVACLLLGSLLAFAYGKVGQLVNYASGQQAAQCNPIISNFSKLKTGGLPYGLAVGLLFGGLAALWHGGLDLVQHGVLRLTLYATGLGPLNFAQFLDYSNERIFLRRAGGGYIFISSLLMEHFAQDRVNSSTLLASHTATNDADLSAGGRLSRLLVQGRQWVSRQMANRRWRHLQSVQWLRVGVLVVGLLLILWGWQVIGPSLSEESPRTIATGLTLWDWMDMLLVPVLLTAGGLFFYRLRQRSEERATQRWDAVQQQLQAGAEREKQLEARLEQITTLLSEEKQEQTSTEDARNS